MSVVNVVKAEVPEVDFVGVAFDAMKKERTRTVEEKKMQKAGFEPDTFRLRTNGACRCTVTADVPSNNEGRSGSWNW